MLPDHEQMPLRLLIASVCAPLKVTHLLIDRRQRAPSLGSVRVAFNSSCALTHTPHRQP
jgi:hypothetical protein